MSDDFIVEDQERSAGSPFLILAGILGAIFFLAVVCIGAVLLTRGDDNETDPAAEGTRIAVVSTNEAIMTQNAFVTQTLIARTMTAAAPTNTSTPLPTATNTPPPTATNTPRPHPPKHRWLARMMAQPRLRNLHRPPAFSVHLFLERVVPAQPQRR